MSAIFSACTAVRARFMAACFALTCVISVAYTSSDVRAVWPMILAIIVCSTAAFTLVLSRGDPMPLGAERSGVSDRRRHERPGVVSGSRPPSTT